jgi:hypothetical protein
MRKPEALIHILVSDRPAQGEMNINFYIILKKDRRTKLYVVRQFAPRHIEVQSLTPTDM